MRLPLDYVTYAPQHANVSTLVFVRDDAKLCVNVWTQLLRSISTFIGENFKYCNSVCTQLSCYVSCSSETTINIISIKEHTYRISWQPLRRKCWTSNLGNHIDTAICVMFVGHDAEKLTNVQMDLSPSVSALVGDDIRHCNHAPAQLPSYPSCSWKTTLSIVRTSKWTYFVTHQTLIRALMC